MDEIESASQLIADGKITNRLYLCKPSLAEQTQNVLGKRNLTRSVAGLDLRKDQEVKVFCEAMVYIEQQGPKH